MSRPPSDSCPSGKRGHLSAPAAKRAAIGAAMRRTGDKLRHYHCPTCHYWHLTSAPLLPIPTPLTRRRPTTRPAPATRAELDAWFTQHGKASS